MFFSRAVLCLLLITSLVNQPALAQEPAKSAAIERVETYLNQLTTLKAQFSQVAPDGALSEGVFYLKRPGKMRWEYAAPTPVLIVSNGSELVFYDKQLEQVSTVPLESTLIGFLAEKPLKLSGRVEVTHTESKNGVLRLSVIQRGKPDEGKLQMTFAENPLELRNLTITDATGQTTQVALESAEFGLDLSPELFIFRDPRGKRR